MHGWTQPNLTHRRGSSIFGWSRVLLTPPCVGVGPRDCKPSLPWVRILNFKHNSPFEKTNVVFIFWIFITWYILNVVFSMSHPISKTIEILLIPSWILVLHRNFVQRSVVDSNRGWCPLTVFSISFFFFSFL